MSADMSPSRKPQISVPIGELTEAELEQIAEYLSVSKSSLVQNPFMEWVKSPTYTNLLRRARAELELKGRVDDWAAQVSERIDVLAEKLGDDDPDVALLRELVGAQSLHKLMNTDN